MIYGTQISSKLNKRAINGLKKFRNEKWNNKINRDTAYAEYLKLY